MEETEETESRYHRYRFNYLTYNLLQTNFFPKCNFIPTQTPTATQPNPLKLYFLILPYHTYDCDRVVVIVASIIMLFFF